jgi:hypothetical protein
VSPLGDKKTIFRTDANRFGFDWPEQNERIPPPGLAENIKGPRVQVTRTGQVYRGKRGTWRILQILTARQTLHVYVTPSGMCRVFDKNGVEWKPVKR